MRGNKGECRGTFARFSTIFLVFLLPAVLQASHFTRESSGDSLKKRRITVLPVPAFGYSPETSTYIGAVTLVSMNLYDDSLTRTSNAKAEFNYTWKKQYITDLGWEIYTKKERFYYKGRITFSRYPDLYYGIGESTPLENETNYDSRRIIADINVLASIQRNWFAGIVLRYNEFDILNQSQSTADSFPELRSASVPGYGLRLMRDKRNSLLNCTEGSYEDLVFSVNHRKGGPYYRLALEGRYYHTFKQVYTLAFRYFGQFTFDNPVFSDLALLGGGEQVRGYYTGRYRDNNLVTIQPEYRSVIYRRWGYALFGGVSKVFPDLEKLRLDHLKLNYGAGIRFMIDRKEKINLRLDYARGNDGSEGFYISFGEAF